MKLYMNKKLWSRAGKLGWHNDASLLWLGNEPIRKDPDTGYAPSNANFLHPASGKQLVLHEGYQVFSAKSDKDKNKL